MMLTERQQQLDTFLHDISGLETIIDRVQNLRHQVMDGRDEIVTLHRL
jgi:hypothetical protein